MFSHACHVLDLSAVLRLVASHCVGDSARTEINATLPTCDRTAISSSLAAIDELRAYRDREGDVVVVDTAYAKHVEACRSESRSLAPESLLDIAAGERAADELHRTLSSLISEYPLLCERANGIVPHSGLADKIETVIEADGSIKDTASPALKRIRKEMVSLRSGLRRLSEKSLKSFGEDALATVLGSRHVLVVPRKRVPRREGIVHSESHSGGSLYFEPPALVEMNNDLETRQADEGAEIARILTALTDEVRAVAGSLLTNAAVISGIDAVRARAIYCSDQRCVTPAISANGRIHLSRARHPLLARVLGEAGSANALVPLDIDVEKGSRVLVITGPNAGGKTVALKTVGICVVMLQCGLQVPCAVPSELPVFESVFVDIGDEQSMESSMSTFTSHLRHLDEMSRAAGDNSLCLIDEIGDGTDPDEGAALAIATLERLLESGAAVVATTHYGRIKTFALETDGVANASMAFDDEDGRPLYRLLQGVAGRSRGLETARRTGFDERVVQRAEAVVGHASFQLEAVLAALETEKLALEKTREEVQQKEMQLEKEILLYREKSKAYDMTRREAQRRALREAEELLVGARRDIENAVRAIREKEAERSAVRRSREAIDEKLARIREQLARQEPAESALQSVAEGDRVSLSPTGKPSGRVISVHGDRAQVEITGKRITIAVEKLYPALDAATSDAPVLYDVPLDPLPSTSIDVRGSEREEALAAVSRFVDRGVLSGVREIRIVHGIGERVLERAVRVYLQGDQRVESFRSGEQIEGGAGVTFVRLK